jgi:uncharacterized protein YndB with AHSA1/START domain
VREFEQDRRLFLEWSDGTTVEWQLSSRADGTTVVEVENSGFKGDPAAATATALEATQGFTIVLCDLKTLVETGASTNLVRDKAALIESRVS